MRRRAHGIAALVFSALVLAKFSTTTGFTSLIHFGETWESRWHTALKNLPIATIHDSNGNDGQFYAKSRCRSVNCCRATSTAAMASR